MPYDDDAQGDRQRALRRGTYNYPTFHTTDQHHQNKPTASPLRPNMRAPRSHSRAQESNRPGSGPSQSFGNYFPAGWEVAHITIRYRKSQQAGTSRCHSGETPTAATLPKSATDNGYPMRSAWRAGAPAWQGPATASTTGGWLAGRCRPKRRGSCRAHRCCRSPATVASHGWCCTDELVEAVCGGVGGRLQLLRGRGFTASQKSWRDHVLKMSNSCSLHAVLYWR